MTLSAVVQSMNCTDNNIFGSVLGKQNNEIMFITLHYTSLEISAGKQISDLILETSKQYLALQSIAWDHTQIKVLSQTSTWWNGTLKCLNNLIKNKISPQLWTL